MARNVDNAMFRCQFLLRAQSLAFAVQVIATTATSTCHR
jgi:hypothetical protein